MKKVLLLAFFIVGISFTGCNQANTVSKNLSTAADNFRILRRVVFFNGITDKYLLEIRGFCSINADMHDKQLEVTCKIGPEKYIKNYFGLSDNTAYFIEQLSSANVSPFYHKVVFRPQSILPSIEFRVTNKSPKLSVTEE